MKVIYPQEWDNKKELHFISRIGMEAVLDEHGKFLELRQVKPTAYIVACLSGYIKGAHLRDWVAAGLDGGACVEAAKTRLKEMGGEK